MFSVNSEKSFLCVHQISSPFWWAAVSYLGISLVKIHSSCNSASLWLSCRTEVQHPNAKQII